MNASPFSGARERAEWENSAPTGPPHSLSLSSLVPGEPWKRDDDDAARWFFLSPSSFHCSPLDGTPRKIEGEREFEAAEKKIRQFWEGKSQGSFSESREEEGTLRFRAVTGPASFLPRKKVFSFAFLAASAKSDSALAVAAADARDSLPFERDLRCGYHPSRLRGAGSRGRKKSEGEREIASRGFIDNLILPQRSGRGLVFKSSTLFTRIISDFVTPRRRTPPYFSEMRYPS